MNLYDPELFSRTATMLTHELKQYLQKVREAPHFAVDPLGPQEMLAKIQELSRPGSAELESRLQEIVQSTLRYTLRLHSPHYIGHQVNPPIPMASALQMVGGVLNPGLAVYEMSQFAAAAERFLLKELVAKVGWDFPKSDGIVTSGGTLANITAILAARGFHFGNAWRSGLGAAKPAILISAESHYSLVRAAGILGLGTEAVFKVPVDNQRRMRADQLAAVKLDAESKGFQVFCVVGAACTTSVGAFDPLVEIGKFCAANRLWFHVDAAHGGSYLLSDSQKHLLRGIELADSVTWDAHKMMFVPSLCTFLLYRDRTRSYLPFQQEAPYLFSGDGQEARDFDSGLRTFECTKGQLAYPVWVMWALYGPEVFAELMDKTSHATHDFWKHIQAVEDFTSLHEPECNIFCFRYSPKSMANATGVALSELQKRIRAEILRQGRFYITGTEFDGIYALRVTVINPTTTMEHLKELLAHVRSIGEDLSG